ncbi:hypothetical protein BJ944DRAFT_268536 [Cunninghamella echinulata]|nr:hypothetical protein BJ944DRAFT_268536 [Cunninghamella echinulata]
MRFLTSLVINSSNPHHHPRPHHPHNFTTNKENKISPQYIYHDKTDNHSNSKKSLYRRWSFPFQFSKRSSVKSASSNSSNISFTDLLLDFKSQYRFANEELDCAIKSQGSNYYLDDYYDAKEAIEKCLQDYQKLIDHVCQEDVVYWLNNEWNDSLIHLTSTMQKLTPPPV